MYKIMLVDDEDEVREGITQTVDFAACGFMLCAQATGAIDALEKAAQHHPDVVFTDVHMPYMDGMEMISRLQEMYPAMKYIVLSGYDDFIYVKQALQRQVMDYLLKPLSAQGIMRVLSLAREKLDQERMERTNLELLRQKADESVQQLRRSVFLEFLSGNYDDTQALCTYPLPASVQVHFPVYIALISLERTSGNLEILSRDFDNQPQLLGMSVSGVLGEVVRRHQVGECMDYRRQFLLILPTSQEEALSISNDAVESLRHYLRLTANAGISTPAHSYAGLSEAYQSALAALDRRLLAPRSGIYTARVDSTLFERRLMTEDTLATLSALCRGGQEREIHAYYAQLGQSIVEQGLSQSRKQLDLALILSVVLAAAWRAGVDAGSGFAQFHPEAVLLPNQLSTSLNELCQLTLYVADTVRRDMDSSSGVEAIASAIAYTKANYPNKELSLESLCVEFRMSQTQFSLLFKRETGTSFLQYLLDLRITTAKEMLLTTSKKIYQIAEETGFGDASYFSYCFKQRCGLSPKEFRYQGSEA